MVLAINYASPDAVIHSGSVMTVFGVAVVPTQQLDISVTAAPTQLVMTLGSSYFAGLPGNTPVYITDGYRAWAVFTTAGVPTVTINSGLIVGHPAPGHPMYVSDYTTLVNNSFRAYTGSLVIGGAFGAQYSVNIGAFGNLALHDDGSFGVDGDLTGSDGLWTGLYNVPDLGYTVTNGSFFGFVESNGVANDPTASVSRSVVSFNIDGIRPQILTHSISFRRTNYNGLMYISSLSGGTTTPEPTNDQARFNLVVNKPNTAVDIVIQTPAGKVSLPTLTIPSSATTLSAWRAWDGRDPNNQYVKPNPGTGYPAFMYIHDLTNPNFVGVTQTATIDVVDLNMVISNINLSPSSSYVGSPQSIITQVTYNNTLSTDTGSSLAPSLQVLGWTTAAYVPTAHADSNGSGPFTSYTCLACGVFALPQEQFLNPDGSTAITFPGFDAHPLNDDDLTWIELFAGDFSIWDDCGDFSGTFEPTTVVPGAVVAIGDGNTTNDFSPDLMGWYGLGGGTPAAPTSLVAALGQTFSGTVPPAGSYTLQIHDVLTGMQDWRVGDLASTPDTTQPCVPQQQPVYVGDHRHFAPDAIPAGNTSFRGRGIYTDDSSVLYSVNTQQVQTGDTTPPFLVSSNPVSGSQVDPSQSVGLFEIGNPLTALVQDNETPINLSGQVTYATLTDKNGAQVAGQSSTNGGGINNSAQISFSPQTPLRTGGTYKFNVFSCNVNGLCLTQSIQFTVQDQTAPSVSDVELMSSTQQNTIVLSPLDQNSPYGPFDDINGVQATLYIDPNQSSNSVSAANSSISVYQVVNGQNIPVPLSNTSVVLSPDNVKLTARLLNTISGAGLFQIVVQSESTDGNGNLFSGPPAPWIAPEFITQVNPNLLNIYFNNSNNRIAMQGLQPITITAEPAGTNVPATTGNLQAVLPNLAAFPTPPGGYLPVTASAGNSHALEINALNLTYTARLQFNYVPTTPISIILHWDDADLKAYGVISSQLTMLGYDGANWQTLVPAAVSAPNNGVNNTFTWQPNANQVTYLAYGLFYPTTQPGQTPQPTATPIVFANTRSFNPVSGNPLNDVARFYYGSKMPQAMEARIYDTAGRLVKTLNLGAGIKLSDVFAGQFFFTWDGTNDSGTIVRNGIYLVRWQVTTAGGGADTETKAVALIK